MRKETIIHFIFFISFFLFASLVRGWFEVPYIFFWLGGLVGTLLPEVDHLIYIYFLNPQEHTSLRVMHKVSIKDITGVFSLLADTRTERKNLVFHTALFQLVFVILSFLVITSSGSIFGRGLVLAFLIHLLIDQIIDYVEIGNLNNWFRILKISLDNEKTRIYISVVAVIVLFFGFFL